MSDQLTDALNNLVPTFDADEPDWATSAHGLHEGLRLGMARGEGNRGC